MTNVVILMSDEHSFRVSSVYGHSRVNTPNIERLAGHGVIYDAAYCPSPLCAPSRSSFMAGLPVHRVRVYNNCTVARFDHPSYGGELAKQGIHTVHIGKTDVYNRGDSLGFSEMLRAGDRVDPGDTDFCRDPLTIRDDGPERANGFGPRKNAFAADMSVVDAALEWLVSDAPSHQSPWTLAVNVVAPHFPHVATPEMWEKYSDAGDLPALGPETESATHPYAQDLRAHFQTDRFTETQIRGLRQGYLAGVDFVDQQLGRLLDTLEQQDLLDDTLVVYTADHGEMLGKFGMWWKCSMYEDAVRVPLILAGPGFPRGLRSAAPVTLLDLQATLFRATGAKRPLEWWGTPMQDLPIQDQHRVVLAEYHGHGTRGGSFMVRRGDWKLLYHEAAPHQLFNLVDDPDELQNRYGGEPGLAADLERELRCLCCPEEEFRRARAFERWQLDTLAGAATSAESTRDGVN